MKNTIKSNLLLIMTSAIWGFAFVAQLLGAQHVGTFTLNGVRFLLGGISLIPVILLFERIKTDKNRMTNTIIIASITGIVLFTASTLQQYGIAITGSAGKAGFITGLYTVLVPIISMLWGKKTSLNTWLGVFLAVIGLYLLSFSDGFMAVGIGDIVLLLCAVMYAVHIILIDRYSDSIYPLRFAMIQFIVCGAISSVCAFIFEDISLSAIYSARFPILYAGIMSVGVAYTCQILGQKNSDPTSAAIIMSTESVFSAVGEAIVFGLFLTSYPYTPMSLRAYIGCAIMFAGIIVSQLKSKNK